jgi:hypothetical protein
MRNLTMLCALLGGFMLALSAAALDTNAVALLTKAPAIHGDSYRCGDMVRAVNSLRHLGKEQALAVLGNHLRQNDRYGSPDQYWKLHLVCRLLFVNPQGWKFPRLGQPEPEINWNIGEHLPQFPMAISNGVPFMLIRGYSAAGFTGDTPEKTLELCESFPLLSADLSENGYEKAARDLIKSEMFQKLYSTPGGRKEAADMLLVQAGAKEPEKLEGTSTLTITITPSPEDKK